MASNQSSQFVALCDSTANTYVPGRGSRLWQAGQLSYSGGRLSMRVLAPAHFLLGKYSDQVGKAAGELPQDRLSWAASQ